MKLRALAACVAASALLCGCAPKMIALDADFLQQKQGRIGVVFFRPRPPALYKEGSQGLLDIAISSAVTKPLDDRIAALDTSGLERLAADFAGVLKAHGQNVVVTTVLPPEEGAAAVSEDRLEKEVLPGLVEKLKVDKLLVVAVRGGFSRQYYSIIPLTAPAPVVTGAEVIIDDQKNILWRHSFALHHPALTDWDQPPDYPAVVAAWKAIVADAVEKMPQDLH